MRGYLLMGTRAQMAEAGKTTENRPLHRQNWVRIRRVTPPRKSAYITKLVESLPKELRGNLPSPKQFEAELEKSEDEGK